MKRVAEEQEDKALTEGGRSVTSQLAALRIFEVFGRVGGVRHTASALRLDPSIVSRQLRGLETWLGAELVDRRQRPAGLTHLGDRYHKQIQSAFEIIGNATDEISGAGDNNHLVIYCTHGLAHCLLFKRIDEFRRDNPDIDIEIHPKSLNIGNATTDIKYNASDFISLSIDFSVDLIQDDNVSHMHVLPLVKTNIFPVVSPRYLEENPLPVSAEDLLNKYILHADDDFLWRTWLMVQGISVPDYIPGVRGWHTDYVFDAARRGEGVAMATQLVPSEDLAHGRLRPLKLRGGDSFNPVYGLYRLVGRQDQWTRRSVRIFRIWLYSILQETVRKSSHENPPV